ncbi:MAG: peptide chain release factor N(5)-glutamine methyltransferase [Bacteroidia bacterium]|nr:peptide chain release factor N(5)-glutamine methyltransferase [Bacteroidia bacterium]
MSKVQDLQSIYRTDLSLLYEQEELEQIIQMSFEHVCGFTRADLFLQRELELMKDQDLELRRILEHLKLNEPIQYILGYSWFAGRKFIVSHDVLIPRQETEELVNWIVSDFKSMAHSGLRVLDLCTGSACIAVSVSLAFKSWTIFGLDISEPALKVASKNNSELSASVEFVKGDVLRWDSDPIFQKFQGHGEKSLDIIVSNPPYVGVNEKSMMSERVLAHEPGLALFVPEDDPLVFYRQIIDFAKTSLRNNGRVYVEINREFGAEIVNLFSERNFSDIQLRKDIAGNDRMISATLRS